jgi:hypothetical protein
MGVPPIQSTTVSAILGLAMGVPIDKMRSGLRLAADRALGDCSGWNGVDVRQGP